MKYVFLITLFALPGIIFSQDLKPASISVAYFGEAITHPGFKLSFNYELVKWTQSKTRNTGKSKTIETTVSVSPSLGFFYHKDYQTSFLAVPELNYTRKKVNGNFVTYGLGTGYMRTLIPDVYDLNSDGDPVLTKAGYNYFLTNYFIAFGKDLSVKYNTPLSIYIKPQLMYALPAKPTGTWYFALEVGVCYKL